MPSSTGVSGQASILHLGGETQAAAPEKTPYERFLSERIAKIRQRLIPLMPTGTVSAPDIPRQISLIFRSFAEEGLISQAEWKLGGLTFFIEEKGGDFYQGSVAYFKGLTGYRTVQEALSFLQDLKLLSAHNYMPDAQRILQHSGGAGIAERNSRLTALQQTLDSFKTAHPDLIQHAKAAIQREIDKSSKRDTGDLPHLSGSFTLTSSADGMASGSYSAQPLPAASKTGGPKASAVQLFGHPANSFSLQLPQPGQNAFIPYNAPALARNLGERSPYAFRRVRRKDFTPHFNVRRRVQIQAAFNARRRQRHAALSFAAATRFAATASRALAMRPAVWLKR